VTNRFVDAVLGPHQLTEPRRRRSEPGVGHGLFDGRAEPIGVEVALVGERTAKRRWLGIGEEPVARDRGGGRPVRGARQAFS
jgi:hypothetical protein